MTRTAWQPPDPLDNVTLVLGRMSVRLRQRSPCGLGLSAVEPASRSDVL